MSSRDAVLARISGALNRSPSAKAPSVADQPSTVSTRLHGHKRHTLPAVGSDLIQTTIHNMEAVLMSVVRLQSRSECVDAVGQFLASHQIDAQTPGSVSIAPALRGLSWPQHYSSGPATGLEQVSVTPCLAAVAETGSVVVASSATTPATLAFLPDIHIVLVHESQLVCHVEDVFTLLRESSILPRAVSFITGPSRTADIEQTLEIGAHGPRQMHILLISDPP